MPIERTLHCRVTNLSFTSRLEVVSVVGYTSYGSAVDVELTAADGSGQRVELTVAVEDQPRIGDRYVVTVTPEPSERDRG